MNWLTVAEVAVGITLVYLLTSIVIEDLKNYRIRNTAVAMLGGLFFLWCLIRGDLTLAKNHFAAAAIIFVVLATMYRFRMMGGGDVKLLTVAFLWLGPEQGFLFSLLLCLVALLYVVFARFKWVPSRDQGKRTNVPFGPSIAVAWFATMLVTQLHSVSG